MRLPLLPAFTGHPQINRVYHCELFTLCDAMPAQSVDLILADLPYGTTACHWDEVIPFEPMWARFKRIIKPRGAMVLTASQPFTSALVMSNPKMFRYEWVWEKDKAAGFMNANLMPLRAHENIVVFGDEALAYYPQKLIDQALSNRQGRRSVSNPKVYRDGIIPRSDPSTERFPRDVLKFNTVNSSHIPLHPTQKPLALFEYLIRTYTREGELVFDPCVGSGTTALAARNCKRQFICGDKELEYVQIARDRLRMPFEKRERPTVNDVSDLPLFATQQHAE